MILIPDDDEFHIFDRYGTAGSTVFLIDPEGKIVFSDSGSDKVKAIPDTFLTDKSIYYSMFSILPRISISLVSNSVELCELNLYYALNVYIELDDRTYFFPRRSPRDFYLTYKFNNKSDTSMNKILIVDASDSDCRLMSGLLTRAGYEPVIAEDM